MVFRASYETMNIGIWSKVSSTIVYTVYCTYICKCEQMGVSENGGTPKSSILIGFSIINHPFWGTPIFGNTQIICFCFHWLNWFRASFFAYHENAGHVKINQQRVGPDLTEARAN